MGGPSEIPYRIISVIERNGGCVMVNANVKEILIENGRATGVRVHSSSGDSWLNIYSPVVISDAGEIRSFFASLTIGLNFIWFCRCLQHFDQVFTWKCCQNVANVANSCQFKTSHRFDGCLCGIERNGQGTGTHRSKYTFNQYQRFRKSNSFWTYFSLINDFCILIVFFYRNSITL